MEIETRTERDVTILSPKGKITIGAGDVAIRDAIQQTLDSGVKKILVDMSGVTTIDSSGIGELVHSYTRTINHGGKLILCSLPLKIQDMLIITQLITVFDIYDDETEAIMSFE